MNIGIVTTWFERGAAYVSKAYLESLKKEGHKVYIYARGGENMAIGDSKWNTENVTWGKKLRGNNINRNNFFKWILENKLDTILFNEQNNYYILYLTKKKFPEIKLAAYVDYYTEDSLILFNVYDFVICNTKRHMQALDQHPQAFYLKWGTDINLFKPTEIPKDQITFFHSVGMSDRKGTDILINAFITGNLYEKSKLIIHTQIPIEQVCKYKKTELQKYSVEIIEKTVTAPGLYHLGDIYVYPTKLDGLGLTMYEALACGLPVITTNYPPMNEIIDNTIGRLVEVERNYARKDAYYWPLSICSTNSLINCMMEYVNNPDLLNRQRIEARKRAEYDCHWASHSKELSSIFTSAIIRKVDENVMAEIKKKYYRGYIGDFLRESELATRLYELIRR